MGSPYYYTQGEFWGGANASKAIYMILAILPITGILGLDHLYLHSPGTFVLKAVFNILTLGYWYFYDAVQAMYYEGEDVAKAGLSIPWFGPSGLAAGAFKGEGGREAPQSGLTFMGYVLAAMFVPFGLDYLIAGDYLGAVWKYLSLFMFGVGFIFGIINVYKIVFKPADVFCEGTYRYFPFTLASDKMNPDVEFTTKVGCPPRPVGGAGGGAGFFEFFKGVSKALNRIPVVGPKFAAPIDAAVTTVETAAATATAAVATAKAAVETVTETIPAVVGTATTLAQTVTPGKLVSAAMTSVPGLAQPPGPGLAQPPGPGLAQPPGPVPVPAKQQGGAVIPDSPSPVLIFALGLVFVTSAFVTIRGALDRLKGWVADMPPIPMPGAAGAAGAEPSPQHISDVGDLPPGASEPGFL